MSQPRFEIGQRVSISVALIDGSVIKHRGYVANILFEGIYVIFTPINDHYYHRHGYAIQAVSPLESLAEAAD